MENALLTNLPQYAPYIIIVVAFLVYYKIFVTPKDLDNELEKKLEKYVLKETHDVTVREIKEDIAEIKDKIDKIYDKLVNV